MRKVGARHAGAPPGCQGVRQGQGQGQEGGRAGGAGRCCRPPGGSAEGGAMTTPSNTFVEFMLHVACTPNATCQVGGFCYGWLGTGRGLCRAAGRARARRGYAAFCRLTRWGNGQLRHGCVTLLCNAPHCTAPSCGPTDWGVALMSHLSCGRNPGGRWWPSSTSSSSGSARSGVCVRDRPDCSPPAHAIDPCVLEQVCTNQIASGNATTQECESEMKRERGCARSSTCT
eukprot:9203707-Pyramimonas_sp.AAC.1